MLIKIITLIKMATQQTNPVYNFAETQRRPTLGSQLSQMTTQQVLPNTIKLVSEINGLKQAQKHMSVELKLLMEVCNKIGENVADVKNKLSQYDIDGDEVSNAEESDDDEVNESADEGESQQADDDANDMEEDKSPNNAGESLGVGIAVDTETNSETEKNSDHKPKRKYTRHPKK